MFARRLLPLALLACFSAAAEDAPAIAAPDEHVVARLAELEYTYEMDEDGDFRLDFELEDGRQQLAWIRNRTYENHGVAMRDVWSVAFRLPGKYVSIKLADRLLTGSWKGVLGGWARDGDQIIYIVKVPATADAALLAAALGEAIDNADALERERSEQDNY